MEPASGSWRRVGPDRSAVSLDDALDGGQADPAPRKALLVMQSLVQIEQAIHVAHVEADAVVRNTEDPATLRVGGRVQFDRWLRDRCSVFPGVAQQVLENDPQQGRITVRLQVLADSHLDAARRLVSRKGLDHFVGDASQVHGDGGQRLEGEARKLEHGVDHVAHARAAGQDVCQIFARRRVELRRMILQQESGEAVHGPQRRAQVVRDAARKSLGLARELFEPAGSIGEVRAQRLLGLRACTQCGDLRFGGIQSQH